MLIKSPHAIKSVDIPFWHTKSDSGVVLPAFLDPGSLLEIKTRSILDTDIFISSYPKSGSTWMKTMLGELMNTNIPMFCSLPRDLLSHVTSPRVFKEHLPLDLMPEGIVNSECKVIYLIRNPKDTVVSYQHHMTMFKMDDYAEDLHTMTRLFCEDKAQFGGWADHVNGWSFSGNIPSHRLLVVTYEDMISDCLDVMRTIVTFLGLDHIDEGALSKVVEESQFDKMKKKDLQHVPGSPSFFGRHALKDQKVHFLREGKAGGWRRALTVADSEMIDQYLDKITAGLRKKLDKLGVL